MFCAFSGALQRELHMVIAAYWHQKAIENLFHRKNAAFIILPVAICMQLYTTVWTLKAMKQWSSLSTKLKVVTRGQQIEISTMGRNPFMMYNLRASNLSQNYGEQ